MGRTMAMQEGVGHWSGVPWLRRLGTGAGRIVAVVFQVPRMPRGARRSKASSRWPEGKTQRQWMRGRRAFGPILTGLLPGAASLAGRAAAGLPVTVIAEPLGIVQKGVIT